MSAFLTVMVIFLLGLMSPGPDFAFIVKQGITRSRRTGILSAFGIALANMVHITYCILGIGVVITQSILLFNTLKYLGAAYLIYLGVRALATRSPLPVMDAPDVRQADVPALKAIGSGLLCNVFNPKCTVFFLALFTQVIDPKTPILVEWCYGIVMAATAFTWFSLVATLFSLPQVRRTFSRVQKHVDRVMGLVLIAFGIKVALASRD